MPDLYYQDAYKKARKEFRACVAAGEYPYLPRLDEFLTPEQTARGIDLGTVQVPLELIVGTKSGGRTNAFARNFLPLLPEGSEFSDKWQRLCAAHLEEGIRDPITALEYMNRFYVMEGNKRVSVFKYFGAASIPAHVLRILPKRNGSKEVELYYAFLDFYRDSRLNFLEFSKTASYREILEFLDQEPGKTWTEEARSRFTAAYYRFRKVYEGKGGGRLAMTAGDALLAYLRVYGYGDLRAISEEELETRVSKVWEEIALQQEESSIDVKLTPAEEKGSLSKDTALIKDALKETLKDTGLLTKAAVALVTGIGKPALKAAFLHDKTPESSGWTYSHELGRRHVEEAFNGAVRTTAYFNAMDKDPGAVLQAAADAGHTVIFTTSPRLLPASLRMAVERPDLTIFNCSLNAPHRYVRTYYARMYEPKFILGAVAGAMAGGDDIGYLCNYPIFGNVSGINAFALGVQMTNPRARVYLEWTAVGALEGGAGVSAAAKRLRERGIRLISLLDFPEPSPKEVKLRELGFAGNLEFSGASGLCLVAERERIQLAAPRWKWGAYYEALLRRIRDKSLQSEYAESRKALNYYWGIAENAADFTCSNKLPESVRRLAALLRESVCSGVCDPFRGPLYARDGKLVQAAHRSSTPQWIMEMDWLNENVVGTIPAYQDLNDTGKATVEIAGVAPARRKEDARL